MISAIFQVRRAGMTGVANVPSQTYTVVDQFEGDIIPKFNQFQDVEQATLITVDNEITTKRLVNVEINDEVMSMASATIYRVVKVFRYEGPRTIIWVATSETTGEN